MIFFSLPYQFVNPLTVAFTSVLIAGAQMYSAVVNCMYRLP